MDYFIVVSATSSSGPFFAVNVGRLIKVHSSGKRYPMSELYDTQREAQSVADWLDDRAAGYPSLRHLKGEANWPNPDVRP